MQLCYCVFSCFEIGLVSYNVRTEESAALCVNWLMAHSCWCFAGWEQLRVVITSARGVIVCGLPTQLRLCFDVCVWPPPEVVWLIGSQPVPHASWMRLHLRSHVVRLYPILILSPRTHLNRPPHVNEIFVYSTVSGIGDTSHKMVRCEETLESKCDALASNSSVNVIN